MIDLNAINENLAKAKADVEFWEKARALFLDPRITQANSTQLTALPAPSPVGPPSRPYGELKRKVLETLPEWKDEGECYSTTAIVKKMEARGYVFASKTPAISVNEALVNLDKEGLAAVGNTVNGTRYWIKAPPKDQEAPEGAS